MIHRTTSVVLFFSLFALRLQPVAATFKYFAGYEPQTNVTAPSRIDLDLEDIVSSLGGTCGVSCLLKDCDAETVAAKGDGCNYDGSIVPWPRRSPRRAFFIENGGLDTMISPKLLSKKSTAFGGGRGTVVAFGGGDGGSDSDRGVDGDENANISPETSTRVF